MKLNFKFKDEVGSPPRQRLIRSLQEHGASAVRPLFPAESDRDLGAFFVVEAKKDETAEGLLELLNESELVDFAEAEVVRKLVR